VIETTAQLSAYARQAAQRRDWATVGRCAGELIRRDSVNPEGHFLAGLAERASRRPRQAAEHFGRALALDEGRYDAALELANLHSVTGRHAEAFGLLERYAPRLDDSPRYLDIAGLAYSAIGLPERALPLHRRAGELQPEVPKFMANLAACCVTLGLIDESRALYLKLLERDPTHQRNHYQLAQLGRARDDGHVRQMLAVLLQTRLPPAQNIFLHYALGKELEDLGRWEEAFDHFRRAGDAASSVSNYDVATDIALIDSIIETCDAGWLGQAPSRTLASPVENTPLFIVGLPRTGTTLAERILTSHSKVGGIGETLQIEAMLCRLGGGDTITPALIRAAANGDMSLLSSGYVDAVRYRLGPKPMFIEKYPENFHYLGFIARAWPDAPLIYLRRHPMDACLALYKQSYFRYAYTLEHLGRYYIAHDRLLRHWRRVLGERLIEVQYESVVTDPEPRIRELLQRLGLDFEPACMAIEKNKAPSATASAVQVREPIHARSVDHWRHFARQLEPLRKMLADAGIPIA
jgi:tetratricopeptide (TPR) repeat protein